LEHYTKKTPMAILSNIEKTFFQKIWTTEIHAAQKSLENAFIAKRPVGRELPVDLGRGFRRFLRRPEAML